MTAEIVSPARLKARQAEAARKERETLRPYQIDGCYFMATKEDADPNKMSLGDQGSPCMTVKNELIDTTVTNAVKPLRF